MAAKSGREEKVSVCIRWMLKRDMPEVLAIEEQSFKRPWTEEDFCRCLRLNCIGLVAKNGEKIVGFVIYELRERKNHIINFAVPLSMRRKGIGSQLVAKIVSKLSSHRRTRITVEVRETNLSAQLFFRKQGFRSVRIVHGYYKDGKEDAYSMEYRLAGADDDEEDDLFL